MTGNAQISQKYQNHRCHSKANSKSWVPGQKKKDGNIEAADNAKSEALALNHEEIGGDAQRMFLGGDRKIIRAVTWDKN